MEKPDKQKIRDWQGNRIKDHTPPPSPEQIRRELGWDLVPKDKKEQTPKI